MTIQIRFREVRAQGQHVGVRHVQYTTDAPDFRTAMGEALFAFDRQFPKVAAWGEVDAITRVDAAVTSDILR